MYKVTTPDNGPGQARLMGSEEALAETIKQRVRLGGPQAEHAAAIARSFAHLYYRRQYNSGLTEVTFYVAAGLTATGELQ